MKHEPENVSRETQERLDIFAALLVAWNQKINLVSRADVSNIVPRHILDSLQLRRFLPPRLPCFLDVGSGAGFPGLVLSIATHIPVTLVESDLRKCAFLREAVRVTEAPAEIIPTRIERVARPLFPLITARALAPLGKLLDLCVPHLQPAGILLFPKGAAIDAEIAEAETAWTMTIERNASATAQTGTILRISGVSRA